MIESVLAKHNAKLGTKITVKSLISVGVVALAVLLPQLVLSPLVSFAITSLTGNAMPAASRLPYMMAELAVFAAVSGLFSKKIAENGWMAFPAVLLAQVSGRAVFLALAAVFQGVSALSAAAVWSQIQAGLLGMVLQAVLVPFIAMGLRALLLRDKE